MHLPASLAYKYYSIHTKYYKYTSFDEDNNEQNTFYTFINVDNLSQINKLNSQVLNSEQQKIKATKHFSYFLFLNTSINRNVGFTKASSYDNSLVVSSHADYYATVSTTLNTRGH